jgi:5-methylthioadenosine/S-adenosylhomocysteine deaminase
MNEKDEIIEGGQILIQNGEIINIGKDLDVRDGVRRRIDCRGKIVMPGLCNCHSHLEEIVERGMIASMPLEPWFFYKIAMENYLDLPAEEIEIVICHACIEMIRNGVTSVFHHYYGRPSLTLERTKPVVRAFEKIGMRAILTPAISDIKIQDTIPLEMDSLPYELKRKLVETQPPSVEECLGTSEEIVEYIKSCSRLINVALGPSGPQRCSDRLLLEIKKLAEKHKIRIHTHLLETKVQAMMGHRLYGKTIVEHMEDLGILFPGLTVAHTIWVTHRDIDLLAKYGVGVVHNPASNLKLGDGICPVKRMMKIGVNVGLGTDGANCGDTYSVFDQVRLVSLIHNIANPDPDLWVTPKEALRMGTVNGGRIISYGDSVGALEKGKRADIIILRPSITYIPFNDVINQLAYTETGHSVETVMIDGHIVMEGGVIKTVNEDEIYGEIGNIAARLFENKEEANLEGRLFEPYLMEMHRRVAKEWVFDPMR